MVHFHFHFDFFLRMALRLCFACIRAYLDGRRDGALKVGVAFGCLSGEHPATKREWAYGMQWMIPRNGLWKVHMDFATKGV
jgi:hypothetical protein